MRIPEVSKQPSEVFSVGLKYVSPDLDEGGRLLSADVSVRPTEIGGLAKVGNVVIEPDTASQMVSGGVDGHEYYVTFKVVTSGGHTYEDEIFIKVREH